MDKGFGNPLRRIRKWIHRAYAKGFQYPRGHTEPCSIMRFAPWVDLGSELAVAAREEACGAEGEEGEGGWLGNGGGDHGFACGYAEGAAPH